jgi:hypothetical protein
LTSPRDGAQLARNVGPSSLPASAGRSSTCCATRGPRRGYDANRAMRLAPLLRPRPLMASTTRSPLVEVRDGPG